MPRMVEMGELNEQFWEILMDLERDKYRAREEHLGAAA